jgi:hypothetical protein
LTLAARSAASEQSGASYTIAKQRFDVAGISEYSAASTRPAGGSERHQCHRFCVIKQPLMVRPRARSGFQLLPRL